MIDTVIPRSTSPKVTKSDILVEHFKTDQNTLYSVDEQKEKQRPQYFTKKSFIDTYQDVA